MEQVGARRAANLADRAGAAVRLPCCACYVTFGVGYRVVLDQSSRARAEVASRSSYWLIRERDFGADVPISDPGLRHQGSASVAPGWICSNDLPRGMYGSASRSQEKLHVHLARPGSAFGPFPPPPGLDAR